MKATIIVQMDHAAFDAPGPELARILAELAEAITDREWHARPDVPPVLSILHDLNGNATGRLTITGTERRPRRRRTEG